MQKKLYIVINIGCIECGVSSNIVGCYTDKDYAENIAKNCIELFDFREGGQNYFEVFELGEKNITLNEYKDALDL